MKICEDIAQEMEAVDARLDSDLIFIRQILVDHALDHGLVVDSSLSEGQGTFATVCRGRKGTEDVAIKVLRGSYIKQLSTAFKDTVSSRMTLTNQCFIRVLDHFPVETQQEHFSVVVEEFVGSDVVRLHKFLEENRRQKKMLTADEVATVIRRAAEALRQFHAGKPNGKEAYGLLTPRHSYYDRRGQKLLLPAVGVSNFLWDAIGWERLATWQEETPNLATYVAPEVADGQPATALTDQYMLGQLAFEMLEGRLPFDIRRPAEVNKKADFWNDAEKTASGDWVHAHHAFAKIIFRMLRRDPAQRWTTLEDLRKRLLTLEDENRALAKRTFDGLDGFQLKNNQAFFERFYTEFFKRAPLARGRFRNPADQPQRLMDSTIAILNYHASNEPTSLRGVVNGHRHLGIPPGEVDHFRDAFLETLKKKLPRRMAAERREQILRAWVDLFAPVVEYFKEELAQPAAERASAPVAFPTPRRSRLER